MMLLLKNGNYKCDQLWKIYVKNCFVFQVCLILFLIFRMYKIIIVVIERLRFVVLYKLNFNCGFFDIKEELV